MCGRFCCSLEPNSLKSKVVQDNFSKHKELDWVDQDKYYPSYNVCPTNKVIVMRNEVDKNQHVLQSMTWGYVPCWSRNVDMKKPINARIETLMEKCMYDSSKDNKRCIVFAEGFFEWQKLSNNKRKPFYIKRKDNKLMAFAALYDVNTIIGNNTYSCTIITTHSEDSFKVIHNRMPVILDPTDVDKWLDTNTPWTQTVIDLLTPYQGELTCYQVSEDVGYIKNNSPNLIIPIDSKKSSISYFLKEEKPGDKFKKFDHEQTANTSTTQSNKRKSSTSPEPKKSLKNPKITSFFVKK